MRGEIFSRGEVRRQFDDPGDLIEPAYKCRLVSNDWKHAAKVEQVARLDTFNIGADWSRRGRQFNTELRKSALRARRLRALRAHHLLECAPPSTCSTSPVTCRASVR